jgi:hypothetical protein
MASGFEEHKDEIANFEDDFVDTCYDIIDASYDSSNAYFVTQPDVLEGEYAAPADYVESVRQSNPTPQPSDYDNEHFNHANFRDDISNLAQVELPVFLDGGADPGQFDVVVERLVRAAKHLQDSTGYTGLTELITMIEGWEGEAAYNFQRSVLPNYSVAIVHQLVFVDELIAVALCMKETIERTRGDALGLAQDLYSKINGDGEGVPLDTVLWVAGSILAGLAMLSTTAGVGLAAGVGTWAGFAADKASSAIGHVQKLSGGEEGDRAIKGETAYDFIPSCIEQIKNILDAGISEADTVMSALKSDLSGEGADLLCIDKPKIIDAADSVAGNPDNETFALLDADFAVESVANLRYAGVVTLPTMAYYFDKAYGEVANLSDPFAAGIGSSPVVSGSQNQLAAAIDTLAETFKNTRDYLYQAGVAMKDVADTYFEEDAEHEEMMNKFGAQLEEYQAGATFPAYAPQAPSPNTDL